MLRSLVGSEMCIRDRYICALVVGGSHDGGSTLSPVSRVSGSRNRQLDTHHIVGTCLLYTSDAADEEDSVDLGGRRIIKKKKKKEITNKLILKHKKKQCTN
eukprot:TRINITY_DN9378_c0_g1_i7.p1 TRINITY_DN9378_c0_g1~~TRINITY_DN9378_c0_g1_i7.p1  ORF type:complete len:101 (-),score=29.68 TRINITY_DN9378_c0_g1_i7:34-336(-)